jgi:predicted deacylase
VTSLPELVQSTPPGTTRRGTLTVPLNPDTTLPFIVVRGALEGPLLLVTAGVHGAEYASIEAAYRLGKLEASALRGALVLLPIVNPTAFFQRSIYVNPVDGKNLNRMFPGRAGGTYAERLAFWLHEQQFRHAHALLDLHGGDLVEALEPFTIYTRDHEPSRQLGRAFGLPHLVPGSSPGVSIGVALTHSIPAIVAEAGGQGIWADEHVQWLVDGCHRVMAYLGMSDNAPETGEVTEYAEFAWLRAPSAGLWRPVVTVGQYVERGERIGTLSDLLDDDATTFVAPEAGTVLFLVSSLAMNEGDPLVGIGAGAIPTPAGPLPD